MVEICQFEVFAAIAGTYHVTVSKTSVMTYCYKKKFPTKKNLYTKENSRNLQSNQKITNHININNQKSEFGLTFKYRLGADTTEFADQIYKNMD